MGLIPRKACPALHPALHTILNRKVEMEEGSAVGVCGTIVRVGTDAKAASAKQLMISAVGTWMRQMPDLEAIACMTQRSFAETCTTGHTGCPSGGKFNKCLFPRQKRGR